MNIRAAAVLLAALFIVCATDATCGPAKLTIRVRPGAADGYVVVAIRDALDKSKASGELQFQRDGIVAKKLPGALSESKDGTVTIDLPVSVYLVTASDEPGRKILERQELRAESDERYTITVSRPTLLSAVGGVVGNPANWPVAIITLLAAALASALRDKLKQLWEAILDGIGRLGVRGLRERSFTRAYLRNVIHNHNYLRLIGLNTAGFNRPPLERVFISLRIASYDQRAEAAAAHDPVPFESAMRRFPNLVILGAPGAGKTTTLSYALLQFARGRGQARFGIAEPLLPLFIPLRRLSDGNRTVVDDLLDPATQILPEDVLSKCPPRYFERKLQAGRCILFFDGLDEVASESQHRLVAQKINNLVAAFPGNRIVVTCRTAGWQNLLPGFQVLQTQDLDRAEIHSFIAGWHEAVITEMERTALRVHEPDDARFEEAWRKRKDEVAKAIDVQSRKLINAIEGDQRIQAVATNPMLLSLICLVHLSRHILPRGRSRLYRECVEVLTDAWDRSRDLMSPTELTYSQKEAALRQMAMAFQLSGKGELPRAELETVAAEVARNVGATISGAEFVRLLERRSGMLVERSLDVLGFSHLTLQEYLVALHIQQNPERFDLLRVHADSQGWREVLLLYCGLVDDATAVVNEVLADDSSARILLAARCIGESQNCQADVVETVMSRLGKMLESPQNRPDRDELAQALAAVAADYQDAPVTQGQRFSKYLLEVAFSGSEEQAIIAIDALGLARVTAAIPVLVDALAAASVACRAHARQALTMFGDLAVAELRRKAEEWIRHSHKKELIEVIRTLRSINTVYAARLLAWFGVSTYEYGSLQAMAAMLRNDRIVDELLDIWSDTDLNFANAERTGWKYARPAGGGFRAVENFTRRHIARALEHLDLDPADPPSIRVSLPALLDTMAEPISLETRVAMCRLIGFDDSPELPQVVQETTEAVRRGEADLWTTLERAQIAHDVTRDGGEEPRVLRAVTLGMITTGYVINLWFLAMCATDPIIETFLPALTSAAWVLFGLNVLLIVPAVWLRRRSMRPIEFLSAAVSPYAVFLRRLRALIPGRPWLAFAIFTVAALALSAASISLVAAMQARLDLAPFIFVPLLFVLSAALYYAFIVLRRDPLRQLIELHPEGRELLRRA